GGGWEGGGERGKWRVSHGGYAMASPCAAHRRWGSGSASFVARSRGGRGTDDTQNWYHTIWNPVQPGSTSPRCGLSIASSSPLKRREIGAWGSASYLAFKRGCISLSRGHTRYRLSLAARLACTNDCAISSPCRPSCRMTACVLCSRFRN